MYCKHCGKPIDDDAKFCPECGGIQWEVSQQSQLSTPPAHTPILQVSDVSETQPTPPDRLQEEPPEVIADKTHELEVESETRTNSGWPSTRTYIIFAVSIVLVVAWIFMVRYGGEEKSVGVLERGFSGVSVNEGDTVKIAVISQDDPIKVYGTNKEKFSESTYDHFEYLEGTRYKMNPNERGIVEYTALSGGIWGVAVEGPGDCRVSYRVQILEPLIAGHVRYNIFIPVFIFLVLIVLLVVDLHQYRKQNRRTREYENRLLEDPK